MCLNYEIYQIDITNDPERRCFSELFDDVNELSLVDYHYVKVFKGELEPNTKNPSKTLRRINYIKILNYLFERFNINRPAEFKGRSLSVSDIVKIDNKYFYCQPIGWKEITVV